MSVPWTVFAISGLVMMHQVQEVVSCMRCDLMDKCDYIANSKNFLGKKYYSMREDLIRLWPTVIAKNILSLSKYR